AAAFAAQPMAPQPPGADRLQRRDPAGGGTMSRPMATVVRADAPRLQVEYVDASTPAALLAGDDVLAVFGFGAGAPAALADPRYLRVPLEPHGRARMEVWHGNAPVVRGRDEGVS